MHKFALSKFDVNQIFRAVAIRWINNYPVDNAIGFPKIHKKLPGRWIVIYPVDRRYPKFKQMYEQIYSVY